MMYTVRIDPEDHMPLETQLMRAIRFDIRTGKLRRGEPLPTVRELAVHLRINANIAAKVYAELEQAGLLETKPGTGTVVCEMPTGNDPNAQISMRADDCWYYQRDSVEE